jgi:hypothetical protein
MGLMLSTLHVIQMFGKLTYIEDTAHPGWVIPDIKWRTDNLVQISLPYESNSSPKIFRTVCHKLVKPQLTWAFNELKEQGLLYLIENIGGVYAARHVGRAVNRALSRHSWGIALDLNTLKYPMNAMREQDKRLVEILFKYGFGYGGGNSSSALAAHKKAKLFNTTQDAMHFECVKILTVKP